tara:strand:- start:140 stop:727 length:588 start_codon:yes stop_codon:yes gene_type:complete
VPNSWEEILLTRTPKCWIDRAIDSLDLLLLDHAHCEKKAATTAISLIHRYPEKGLSKYLSPLAREELLHFEQVTRMLKKNGFTYRNLKSGSYAKNLHSLVADQEPERLKDLLLICALIEARSCERFYALAPHLQDSLNFFYTKLCDAESRHCELYLNLYSDLFDEDWSSRLVPFAVLESELISKPDPLFRFHGGV